MILTQMDHKKNEKSRVQVEENDYDCSPRTLKDGKYTL
jgi:hypothetical protein